MRNLELDSYCLSGVDKRLVENSLGYLFMGRTIKWYLRRSYSSCNEMSGNRVLLYSQGPNLGYRL